MSYKIHHNKLTFFRFLNSINQIDKEVFSEDMCGTLKNEISRFIKYPEEFIVLTHNRKVIGYIQYFPIKNEYAEEVLRDNKIHDDDILGRDISRLSKTSPNDIYILSIAILPAYHGGEAIKILAKAFIDKLISLNSEGYKIGRLISTAISDKGRSTLSKFGLKNIKTIDEGYSLFCEEFQKLEIYNTQKEGAEK